MQIHPRSTFRLRLALCCLPVVLGLASCSSDTLTREEWSTATASSSTNPTAVDDTGHVVVQAAADDLVAAGVPGVVIRVIGPSQDQTVTAGVRDIDSGEPMDADTLFNLSAASNPYLATMLLGYFDEARLDLGDSIEDHLPGHFDFGWDIAIWDVLQHASGIPDYLAVGPGRGAVVSACIDAGECRWDVTDALALVDGSEWDFQPGEGWGFSNTNYVLVGELIEEVEDKPWDQALDETVLAPMGLNDTYVPDYASAAPTIARAYSDLDGDGTLVDVTAYLPTDTGADGALAASANDAAAFFHSLFTGQVLSDAGQVALYAVAPTGHGVEDFGLGVTFFEGYDAGKVGVTAENLGQSIVVEHDLASQTTVVVMANRAGDLPLEEWGRLLGAATGSENLTVVERDTTTPGMLRYAVEPSEPS